MAERVFLHIGLMKSGTSFVQQTLLANPAVLAERGVLFPGEGWSDQVRAVRDVAWNDGEGRRHQKAAGAWPALTDEIRAWSGDAIVSMEYLAMVQQPVIERVLTSLAPADVHVVVTVRDLGRNIPAMWQEVVKNGKTWTWQEYVEGIRTAHRRESAPGKTFWRQQDAARIVRRWVDLLPPERLTVVTVPPPGAEPGILWQRFCSVVGMLPDGFDPPVRRNESLGVASTAMLRELNVLLAESGASREAYGPAVKRGLAKSALVGSATVEPGIQFEDARWLHKRSSKMVEELAALPVALVGDLDELVPRAVAGVDPDQVSDRDRLDAALRALARMVKPVSE